MLYYGLIKQSTGENWTNARLSLSTANPSIGGSVPDLGMQLLKFKRVYVASKSSIFYSYASYDLLLLVMILRYMILLLKTAMAVWQSKSYNSLCPQVL